jgi:hypothetical protein
MGTKKREAVLIRTYSAGVHFGYLVERNGKEVQLADARRIWSWQGANTLHEIATGGVGKGSKVSVTVGSITLLEAIEIIPCTPAAVKVLEAAEWGK